jgi:hypothetical protein
MLGQDHSPPRSTSDLEWRYGVVVTARPENESGSYEVVHLGGDVPMLDLRLFQARHRHASAEQLKEAEVEATLTAHREWVAAGRPGAVSHEEAMAELLDRVLDEELPRYSEALERLDQ